MIIGNARSCADHRSEIVRGNLDTSKRSLQWGATCLLGAGIVVLAMLPFFALAQTPPPCIINSDPPAIGFDTRDDRLHTTSSLEAGRAHTGMHGQALHGESTLYLSHLPVFMGRPEAHPHNFQIILEVEFEDPAAARLYREDKAKNPDRIYTVTPQDFDQNTLIADHPGTGPMRHLLSTNVFRGHFEQKGISILTDTNFTIKRVIYFQEFAPNSNKLRSQHYLLYGKGNDALLTHLLSAPPDFDQTVGVEVRATDPSGKIANGEVDALLARGLYVELPDRENIEETRVRPGKTFSCILENNAGEAPITIDLIVSRDLYCEAGEFDVLVTEKFNDFRPCKE
jgi:hypothetical protein